MIKSSQAEKSFKKNGLKKKFVRFASDVCVDETESFYSALSHDGPDENKKPEPKNKNKFTSSEYIMDDFHDDATTTSAANQIANAIIPSYVSSFSSFCIQFFFL